jgi:DNA repair protein RecN (Recombination protein N)
MLKFLRIRNLATIEDLEVRLLAGFSILTGETGAGKSIIIDAVGMLLGGRAQSEFVRANTAKARVEGTFALENAARESIFPILDEIGIEH